MRTLGKWPVELVGGAADGVAFMSPEAKARRPPGSIVFLNEGRELEYVRRMVDGEHARAESGRFLYDFIGIRPRPAG